mgnify:CR=1 FL=1
MAISRKDPKGRKLREGENWRNDGRYSYRYTDVRTGKRLTVYAQDLPELREKEKQIAKDMEDNILTDGAIKKMTLNTLFERYMATRELADTTRVSYVRAWENRVICETFQSWICLFYNQVYSQPALSCIRNGC